MHTFTLFKTETCPWCVQAKGFLDALAERRGDLTLRVVDANQDPAAFREVARRVGRSTVPQIFLDGHYLGGWSELARAAAKGQLDAYLDGQPWQEPKRAKRSWWRSLFGADHRQESAVQVTRRGEDTGQEG